MKTLEKWLWIVWARVCSFFQASSRTVGLSSLIALLIAISIFPIWHRIFTIHDLPIQMKMAAPQEEYVRVYWDNPERHPTAFERIQVRQNPLPNQTLSKYKFLVVRTPWQRLEIVGERDTALDIPIVQVKGKALQADGQTFRLPNYSWNRLNRAIATTVLSWISMTVLFISTVHLWQRKTGSRFSVISYIFFLSVTVSGFWMLVLYPGILSYDALNHWTQALSNQYNAWWPPILAMGMHVTQYWVNDPSLFTFIQGALFWSASLYLLWILVQNGRFFLANASIFILIPPLWLYSNAAVSNTWMATFVIFSAALLLQAGRRTNRALFLASIVSLSLAVCFRREAIFLVIIPIAVYFYCFPISRRLSRRLLEVGTVALAVLVLTIIPAKLITLSPNVSGQSPTGYVFLSQYVGTLANTESLARAEVAVERRSIDQKFGPGTFDEMLKAYTCGNSQATIRYFKQNAFRGEQKQAILFENTGFILQKVAAITLKHPKAYLQHKACNFSYTLQVPQIMYQTWGIIDQGPNRERLNLQFDSRLPQIKAIYAKLLQGLIQHPLFSSLFRHYIFLTCSIAFLIFGALTRNPDFVIPSMFSVIYPVGLIIPDSFPLWRYLFVCYVLAWICLLAASNLLVVEGWHWWQQRTTSQRSTSVHKDT